MIIHTKHQTSRLCGFREDFLRFSYYKFTAVCKTDKPQAGLFLAQGQYLNKLGRGLLGDATYPISMV